MVGLIEGRIAPPRIVPASFTSNSTSQHVRDILHRDRRPSSLFGGNAEVGSVWRPGPGLLCFEFSVLRTTFIELHPLNLS